MVPHDAVRAKASSSPSPLKVLRTYAKLPDSSITALPPTVYFSHTKQTLTIFDAYPKALFHFLVLPRLSDDGERPSPSDLTDLRTLLRQRAFAEETLRVLAEEAARLRGVIEEEMRARYGFAWEVWAGFHAVPSMEHLHLHVISSDLTAQALKTKRHYNSFSPRAGFFVPLAEVRAWFNDATATPQLAKMRRLAPEDYEPRLKRVFECFRCGQRGKNMPALKKHLQEEFDALRRREGKSKKRRREAEDVSVSDRETSGSITKGKGRKVARLS
ncbi:HIT-like domain-containing protein [Lactarius hatsudake]|nr:HIT-like domain-containing protein [Lactarius hatsudake]